MPSSQINFKNLDIFKYLLLGNPYVSTDVFDENGICDSLSVCGLCLF